MALPLSPTPVLKSTIFPLDFYTLAPVSFQLSTPLPQAPFFLMALVPCVLSHHCPRSSFKPVFQLSAQTSFPHGSLYSAPSWVYWSFSLITFAITGICLANNMVPDTQNMYGCESIIYTAFSNFSFHSFPERIVLIGS